MFMQRDENEIKKIFTKKSFQFCHPYNNRDGFMIVWDRNSRICSGIFYMKENEALKVTKFFQISSSALLSLFQNNTELPCISYNRKLSKRHSITMGDRYSLLVCQFFKFQVIKRNSFKPKASTKFNFSGMLGLFKLDGVFRTRKRSRDVVLVLGWEKKGSKSLRGVVFDVRTKRKLLVVNLEGLEIWGVNIKVCFEGIEDCYFGFKKNIKSSTEFEVKNVDLARRCLKGEGRRFKNRFTKVRTGGISKIF